MENEINTQAKKQKISKFPTIAITATITFILCAAIAAALYFTFVKDNPTYIYKYKTVEPKTKPNPYNSNKDGYLSTISDMAEINDMTVEEFKEEWGLPEDMPDDTLDVIAQAYIPLWKYMEASYGMTYEDSYLTSLGITEEDGITKDTPWGQLQKVLNEKQESDTETQETEPTEDEIEEE